MVILLLKLALLCFCASPANSDETTEYASGELGQRVIDWVKAFEPSGFSGSVLVAKDGQVVAATGVGCAIQSASDDAKEVLHPSPTNTPATLFELASCSKPITALTILRMAESQKLALDDSIAKYLPGVPINCRAITVRHLLQHTSGIPGTNFEADFTQLEKTVADYLKEGPVHPPGEHFEYWNQGYALLSAIIARAAQEDDLHVIRREVFQPLGMSVSCFTGDEVSKQTKVATGYSILDRSRSALEHPYGAFDLRYRGMGGVVSNVWDMWRLSAALDKDEFLSARSKKELFAPNAKNYALGWFVLKNRSGRLVQLHSGRVAGFVSYLARFPESQSCIIILCNRDDIDVQQMANDLESLLFGQQPTRQRPPKPVDDTLRQALAGEFHSDAQQICRIRLDGPVTRITIEWSPPNGPATMATLGKSQDNSLVIYEPVGTTPITPEYATDDAVKVVALKLGTRVFKRRPVDLSRRDRPAEVPVSP